MSQNNTMEDTEVLNSQDVIASMSSRSQMSRDGSLEDTEVLNSQDVIASVSSGSQMSRDSSLEDTEVLNSQDVIAPTSSGSQKIVSLDKSYSLSLCSSQSSVLGVGDEFEIINEFPESDMDQATIMFLTECGFSQYIMKWKGNYHI
jgi:hypothetical protein